MAVNPKCGVMALAFNVFIAIYFESPKFKK
jgi:hypothetical protein